MRRFFIVLGLVAAVLALILAVTPLSKLAYIPSLAALIFGLIAFYFSKQKQLPKKAVQLIFLLTIIALSLTTYKAIFNTVELGDTEELKLKEEASIEDSKEILEELDLEDIDLEIDDTNLQMIENEELPDLEGLEEQ